MGHAAVVDPATLKVHGLEGLRVCDASVFPDVVASNIMATVMMVAERGAEFMSNRQSPFAKKTEGRKGWARSPKS